MVISDSLSPKRTFEYAKADTRKGKRRRGFNEVSEPARKSRRLQEQEQCKQSSPTLERFKLQEQLLSPSPSKSLDADSPSAVDIRARKGKASQTIDNTQAQPQVFGVSCNRNFHTQRNIGAPIAGSDRIYHWVHESRWPQRDFEPDLMAGLALKRARSSSSGSQPQPDDLSATPSDQIDRAVKSAPYRDARYAIVLETKGSHMSDSQAGMLAEDAKFCRSLLTLKKNPPSDTLFDDRFFQKTLSKIELENEARTIRDIGHLISPSAECLATRGLRRLDLLKESTNAGWNNAIPFEGPRPQPDFSVGLGRNAFSNDQFGKLRFDLYVKTYYTATYQIYFPFLATEVKCGIQGLDIADRQNAHSMTVAVRGIVELYRAVGRELELHRKVLAFSISHDNSFVRIYAHYPEIDGPETGYYRHLLKAFSLLSEDGKDKWTAYQFVRNVYGSFLSIHIRRIRSAVDQLPESPKQTMVTTVPSSQVTSNPMPPPSTRGVAATLRKQLEQQSQEKERLMDMLNSQQEENRKLMAVMIEKLS